MCVDLGFTHIVAQGGRHYQAETSVLFRSAGTPVEMDFVRGRICAHAPMDNFLQRAEQVQL